TNHLVATLNFTNELAAGSAIMRTQSVSFPIAVPAGSARLLVQVDSEDEVVEKRETNNGLLSDQALRIPTTLSFQFPRTRIAENASNPVLPALLLRNGDLSVPLTANITSGDTTELTGPAMVEFRAGEGSTPVEFTVRQDGIPD